MESYKSFATKYAAKTRNKTLWPDSWFVYKKKNQKTKPLFLTQPRIRWWSNRDLCWPFLLRQCSRTCGGGVQKRDVLCKQRMADGSFLELPETFCSASKPTSQQACKKDDCPSEWLLSDWSEVGLLLRRKECKSWGGGEKSPKHMHSKETKTLLTVRHL